jgi:hypothetical protein
VLLPTTVLEPAADSLRKRAEAISGSQL